MRPRGKTRLPRVLEPVTSVVICTLSLDPIDKLLFKAGTL